MSINDLLLWVMGARHCAQGLEPCYEDKAYLEGYGIQYQIEQNQTSKTE